MNIRTGSLVRSTSESADAIRDAISLSAPTNAGSDFGLGRRRLTTA